MAKKNKNEELYKDFFENLIQQPNSNVTPKPLLPSSHNSEQQEQLNSTFLPPVKDQRSKSIPKPFVINNHNNAIMYEDITISDLPMGTFYQIGTRIQFRDLKVIEIEHFSTLDENSEQDFIDKLNDILENCVLFTHADGTIGSYLDIYEGDRPWIIYMIREKTFPNGKILSITVPYVDDVSGEKKETDIEFRRENFEVYRNTDIMEHFDKSKRCFVFDTIFNEEPYFIAPPTIGLKKCFDQFLKIRIDELKHLPENEMREKINSKFIAMAPYFKPNITYMSYDDIISMQGWFESISPSEYSFFYDLFQHHLKIGIAGLKKNMDKKEIRYNKVYPNKRTTLFLLPNAFRLYLRK